MASVSFVTDTTGGEAPSWTQTQNTDWEVPSGVTSVQVDAGGGQGNEPTGGANSIGSVAAGGRVQCTLAVTPGETLRIRFAGAGQSSPTNAGGYGGMYAAILKTPFGDSDVVVVAGGAGGNGGNNVGAGPAGTGGAGGGTTGVAGTRGRGGAGGFGGGAGTPSAGGAGGTGSSGTDGSAGAALSGGQSQVSAGTRNGGGGGGGYYGGGGGERGNSSGSDGGGGGGGGSSYTDPTDCTGVTHTQGGNAGVAYVTLTYGGARRGIGIFR